MALNSAAVSAGDKAKATQYNNLRTDITSHTHDGTDTAQITAIQTGWAELYAAAAKLAWTYASATTATVAGDYTGTFTKGTKIRLKQGGAYKYFYVTTSSYSNPNTTVTVTGGTDYTLANAAITDNYYSYVENPQGFPHWFDTTDISFTPTTSGSITFTRRMERMKISQSEVTVEGSYEYSSASSPAGSLSIAKADLPAPIGTYASGGAFPLRVPIGAFAFIDISQSNDATGACTYDEESSGVVFSTSTTSSVMANHVSSNDSISFRLIYRLA